MSQLYDTMQISSQGMRAQSTRVRVISENIANAGTMPKTADEMPYQKQHVEFKNVMDRELGHKIVKVDDIKTPKEAEFDLKYMPSHPAANEEGYVRAPKINTLVEMMDVREAQRSYEANIGMFDQSRNMAMRTIDLLR
jgi:flagellar basal-body rod protein FlgC